MPKETINCLIRSIHRMPQNIAHVEVETLNGPLWIETDHATADALTIGGSATFSGEREIERTITFLINTERLS